MKDLWRDNINLIRLLLAVQVMAQHYASYYNFHLSSIVSYFPGVPGFFFLSGLLIHKSYLIRPKNFFFRRFFRIEPLLVVVSLFGIILIIGYFEKKGGGGDSISLELLIIWLFSQISIFQAYNPNEFRGIGTSVINGSLWTIGVEILFYLSFPMLMKAYSSSKLCLLGVFTLSLFVYCYSPEVFNINLYQNHSIKEFLDLTPITWGWMFMVGVYFSIYNKVIQKISKYFLIAIIIITIIINGEYLGFCLVDGKLSPGYFILYIMFIYYIAYKVPIIAFSNDLSYGIYCWHMLVLNFSIVFGINSLPITVSTTIVLSFITFKLIEEPFISFARNK